MPEKVFLNDKIVDAENAVISINDSGFLYGAGLFETMRCHNSVVFSLADHLDRLFFSANSLTIKTPERNFIKDAIYKTIDANDLKDARIRLTLTAGPMVTSPEQTKPTMVITAAEFKAYPVEYYENGVTVVLCPFKQNPTEPVFGHKTTNYFSRMIALNWARSNAAAEAIWFTVDNRLAEACISNVFLVKDSVIYTPPIETPVLAGVSRKTVFNLAKKNSIDLIEKNLYINDLLQADEVFLTNVIMQVMPVSAIEQHKVNDAKVGPITKKLIASFKDYLTEVCRQR